MPINPIATEIKQVKFINALVDSNGNATEAYKAVSGQITTGSAGVGGSRMLNAIKEDSTKEILERVGCTKDAVLQGIWDRMKATKKLGEYTRGADVVCKIGGYYTPNNNLLKDLMTSDVDLVEIIKIRLKSKDKKDIQQKEVIDVSSNSTTKEASS